MNEKRALLFANIHQLVASNYLCETENGGRSVSTRNDAAAVQVEVSRLKQTEERVVLKRKHLGKYHFFNCCHHLKQLRSLSSRFESCGFNLMVINHEKQLLPPNWRQKLLPRKASPRVQIIMLVPLSFSNWLSHQFVVFATHCKPFSVLNVAAYQATLYSSSEPLIGESFSPKIQWSASPFNLVAGSLLCNLKEKPL